MFDGGCRVPFLARWPGKIPPNSSCSEPAMTIDILPTVAQLIGVELPKHPIDGKDIWPLLAGEEGAKSPQEAYYFYWGHNLHAVRSGQWKLHLPHDYRTLSGRPGGTGGIPTKYDAGRIERSLFDLKSDREHSKKCRRPLASGRISPAAAAGVGVAFTFFAVGAGGLIEPPLP